MKMDNLDALSNDELHTRLLQYGFPNLPVTQTTRKVLIKKLRNHIDKTKSTLRRETSYATRYSSDEEQSDRDVGPTKARSRTTIGTIPRKAKLSSFSPPATSTMKYIPPTTSTNNYSASRNTLDASQQQRYSTDHRPQQPSYDFSESVIGADSMPYDNDESDDEQCSPELIGRYSERMPPVSLSNYSPTNRYGQSIGGQSMDSLGRNSYRSDYSAGKYLADRRSQLDQQNGRVTDTSPFVSDYTHRLLSLRGSVITDGKSQRNISPIQSRSQYLNDSSIIGDIVYQSDDIPTTTTPSQSIFSTFFNRLDENYGLKQNMIPCLLLTALTVFIAIVAFKYLTISPDLANTLNPRETAYALCNPNDEHGFDYGSVTTYNRGYSCIPASELESALETLKLVGIELQKRVEMNKCEDSKVPYIMSAREVVQFLVDRDPSKHVRDAMRDIYNMEYLIYMNPKFRINLCDESGSILQMSEVVKMRDSQQNAFAILNPKLPLACFLRNKFEIFFFIIGGIALICLAIYLCNMLYWVIVGYRQQKKEQINQMVADIINILMERAASADPTNPATSLIVVNHLRDKLIKPSDRNEMEWIWDAALTFIEQNESRIQFEMGNRNGEDCKMMRWIDTVLPHHIIAQRTAVKKWQSPAFDKTNKIFDPPTPCLKIRQMFDKYDSTNPNLKQIINDAILEKVGSGCKIYDISLDKTSCCVYVRCATAKDAGRVHDEINGWWFDSRLVSIKFLHLDRYLNRFPNAGAGPQCLKPSNTNNLSMTNCNNQLVNGMEDEDDVDGNGY